MEDERVVAACPLCAMTVTVSTLECPNCGTDLEPAPGMGPAAPEEVAPAGGEVRELDHVRHGELSARVVAGVRALVEICGGDPRGEGMRETPERVLRAYMEMTRGYDEDPRDVLSAVFSQGGDSPVYDEMIILRGIRFSSVCEHHLLPFSGVATVAYVPGETGVVVGLS
jgi:GTP cyclohydrolase I